VNKLIKKTEIDRYKERERKRERGNKQVYKTRDFLGKIDKKISSKY